MNPDPLLSHEYKETQLLDVIDEKIERAAVLLECNDVDLSDEQEAELEMERLYEMRHHCGTCTVRTVMEEVWPAVQEYIDWLRGQVPGIR